MAFENIAGIKIKGANFEEDTELNFFKNRIPTFGLVYGKNGTGKSTISRGFLTIRGEDQESIDSAVLIDAEGKTVVLSEEDKKRIHVYNEDYVDRNIRLRDEDEGLKTIVVLGKNTDIEEELKKALDSYNEVFKVYQEKEQLIKNLCDEKNKESEKYWLNEMMKSLKGADSWAERDSKIKGKGRATSVSIDTYKQFIGRTPRKTLEQLVIDFSEGIVELDEARSGKRKIEREVYFDYSLKLNESTYAGALSKKIEKPVLSEREKHLLELQKSMGQEHPQNIKHLFMSSTENVCPYCLQPVSDEYKRKLFESIENILSKEAEKHIAELKSMQLNQITFDFLPYEELDKKVIDKAKSELDELNVEIEKCNNRLQEKINDVYTPIMKAEWTIEKKLDAFKTSLSELEKLRKEYNESVVDTTKMVSGLNEINSDYAFYKIKDAYEQYTAALEIHNKANEEAENLRKELQKKKDILDKVKEKKKSIKIAVEDINDGLRYIFFSGNRLSIDVEDERYILKSRGKNVSPKKISVGERNAIALCYFFSEIMREQMEGEIYGKEYLLVIDDPVSSFDMENRIGVLSYVKSELNKFVSGNPNTKPLILTHDLQAFFDIEKIFKELGKENDIQSGELYNNHINDLGKKVRNEYSRLMVQIYKYAKGENPNFETGVGNAMRRVLEAYGTFEYKKGIEEISTDKGIKNKLGALGDHFSNLMYRLVLHGESHEEERVKAMLSDDFYAYISEEEKIRTAKEIICFLYLLNPLHVKEHLKRDLDGSELHGYETDISSWVNDIKHMEGIEK